MAALAGSVAVGGAVVSPVQAAQTPTKGSDLIRAKDTPDITKLAGELADQEVDWQTCEPAEEERLQPYVDLAECADIKVPVDWFNPSTEYWTVAVSRVQNVDVDDPAHKGTIFVNPGGPGGSGLIWSGVMHVRTPELNDSYNYVGFDPRGVGASSAPDECLLMQGDTLEGIGAECSTKLENRAISTKQTAYDMDLIRHLLGEDDLSYIGYSYGTWLGSIYAREFPANSGPMLLDSATDITGPNLERTWYMQNIARDRQFTERMLPWVARHGDEFGLSGTAEELEEQYYAGWETLGEWGILYWIFGLSAFSNNDDYPLAGMSISMIIQAGQEAAAGEEITASAAVKHLITAAGRSGQGALIADGTLVDQIDRVLEENTRHVYDEPSDYPKADLSDPRFDPCLESGWVLWDWTDFDDDSVDWLSCDWEIWEEWDELSAEDPSITKEDVVDIMLSIRDLNVSLRDQGLLSAAWYDAFENIRCNDGQWDRNTAKWTDPKYQASIPFSAGLGAGDVPLCAFWTAADTVTKLKANTFPGAMVVQAEMDSQTAYETGLTSGTRAPNTVFIGVDNHGDHGLFPMGTDCVDRPVLDYFLTGQLPRTQVTICDGLPLPWEDVIYENGTPLGPNGKPKKAKPNAQPAAVREANDVARELIADMETSVLLQQALRSN